MKRPKLGINTKQLVPFTLALLIAQNLPLLAAKLGIPASGITGDVIIAAGSIAAGKVLKKPDIANVGVAFAIADLVNSQFLSTLLVSNPPALPAVLQSRLGRRWNGLGAYTANPRMIRPAHTNFYSSNN